jgi:hypothetical protein
VQQLCSPLALDSYVSPAAFDQFNRALFAELRAWAAHSAYEYESTQFEMPYQALLSGRVP